MELYVWLNINTGEFSNSWNSEEYDKSLKQSDIDEAKKKGWKLIKYSCINDENFQFYNKMKLR